MLAQRVLVADGLFQFGAFVIDVVRVEALFDEGVALLLAQVHPANALALELRSRGIQFKVHEIAIVDGLLIGVKISRFAVSAIEGQEGVAIDVIGGRGGQAHLAGVEIFQHFVELVENRAVDFVENNQVEKSGRKLLENIADGLQRDGKQPLGARARVVPTADAGTRFEGQVTFEPVFTGLVYQRIPVSLEQHPPGLVGAHKNINQSHRGARLAGPGRHHNQGFALAARTSRRFDRPEGFFRATRLIRASLRDDWHLKRFTDSLYSLMLVGTIHNPSIDFHRSQRSGILAQVKQAFQVFTGEKTKDFALGALAPRPQNKFQDHWPKNQTV